MSDPDADTQLNFTEADRNVVKDNIIEALIHAPPAIQYIYIPLIIIYFYFQLTLCLPKGHNCHPPLQASVMLISQTSGII